MDLEHAGLYDEDARALARKLGADPNKMVVGQVGERVVCPDCGSRFGPMTSEAPEMWPESVWVCCGYSLIVRTGKPS